MDIIHVFLVSIKFYRYVAFSRISILFPHLFCAWCGLIAWNSTILFSQFIRIACRNNGIKLQWFAIHTRNLYFFCVHLCQSQNTHTHICKVNKLSECVCVCACVFLCFLIEVTYFSFRMIFHMNHGFGLKTITMISSFFFSIDSCPNTPLSLEYFVCSKPCTPHHRFLVTSEIHDKLGILVSYTTNIFDFLRR